jgi:hypothetical protein
LYNPLFVYLLIYLFIPLFIYLFVCLFVCLFVYLLFIYLFIIIVDLFIYYVSSAMVQMQKIHSLFSTQFFNAVLNAAADAAMNAVASMNAVISFS